MVREFSTAALQGCRDKALRKTEEFVNSISEKADDAERFRLLSGHWDRIKTCSAQCGDNFNPELYIQRNNNKLPEGLIQNLFSSYLVSAFQLEVLTQEMGKLGCTKLNGTSVTFADCCDKTQQIRLTVDHALIVYQRGPFAVGELDELEDVPALRA